MLELKGVSFKASSRAKRKILDSVSVKFREAGFFVITGPNGSGKSTLASIIMGLVRPSSGKIFLNGEEISDLAVDERARKGIAFSFQQPVKFKGLTVYDLLNIARGELISKAEAGRYLKKVGLSPEEYLLREVNGKLSGGELKRIEIASVLARGSDLMIFDEPEAGIDLWSFNDLIQIFRKLRDVKKTVIVISHQERILKIADEILILENGKVKEFNKAPKVLPKILEERHGN